MPTHNHELPRFVTTYERGNPDKLLVVIPSEGKRALTVRLTRKSSEAWDDFLVRVTSARDRAWRKLHGGDVPARMFHSNPRIGSQTGVPGVRKVTKTLKSRGRSYELEYIVAEVHTVPGKNYERPRGSRARYFSLQTYGWDEAVALAAAWRAEMIQRLAHKTPDRADAYSTGK